MNSFSDLNIAEEFIDHLHVMITTLEPSALGLDKKDDYYENIDDIFRIFHNLKASSQYFNLQPLEKVSRFAETNLEELRSVENADMINTDPITDWVLLMHDQLAIWAGELDQEKDKLSEPTKEIFNFKIEDHIIQKVPKDIEDEFSEEQLQLAMQNLSVLYIDDNSSLDYNMLSLLEEYFDVVDTINKSQDALKYYESFFKRTSKFYDLVIIDIYKSKINIVDFIKTLRKLNFNQYIITLSQDIDKDTLINFLRLGVNDYLVKPLKYDNIANSLNRANITINHIKEIEIAHNTGEGELINKIKHLEYKIQTLENSVTKNNTGSTFDPQLVEHGEKLLGMQQEIDKLIIYMNSNSLTKNSYHSILNEFIRKMKVFKDAVSKYPSLQNLNNELSELVLLIEKHDLKYDQQQLKTIFSLFDGLSYGFSFCIKKLVKDQKIRQKLMNQIKGDMHTIQDLWIKNEIPK